jgi:chemotaxis protein methyltransferase WspC
VTVIADIALLLGRAMGLNPQSVGLPVVENAVKARIAAIGLKSDAAYLQRLQESPDELRALVEEVVVPETWFFRDGAPFKHLLEKVTVAHRREQGDVPIRILSIPCSTGEEPYSIVMTMLGTTLRFEVDAGDISARAVEKAKAGTYRPSSFRGQINATYRARYFSQDGDQMRISPEVVQRVRFFVGNLSEPIFITPASSYDVIFCRNLLIYFDGAARKQALRTLDRLLAPGGTLFVGHAESLDAMDPRFKVEAADAFAFKRRGRDDSVRAKIVIPPTTPSSKRMPRAGPVPPPPPTAPPPAPEAPPLAKAVTLADEGKLEEALAICRARVGENDPDPEVYCLMGVIHHSREELTDAEKSFLKAVYLDKDHHASLVYLALIYQRLGNEAEAAAFKRRAERARSRS